MDNTTAKNNAKVPVSAEDRDRTIGRALSSQVNNVNPEEACVAMEEVAALIDGTLSGAARDRVVGHLAGCSRCRQVFSLAGEMQQSEQLAVTGRRSGWYVISGMAAIAAMAALAIRLTVQTPTPERQQTAQQTTQSPPAIPHPAAPEPSRQEPAPAKPLLALKPQHSKGLPAELQLLTPEEAALPAAKNFGFSGKAALDGPDISVVTSEEVEEQKGTTSLKIRFLPRKGEKLDLASLKMECLKQTPIDLTARIRPYVGKNGVDVEKMRLPQGVHHFRVSISDLNGRFSEKDFTIAVSGGF